MTSTRSRALLATLLLAAIAPAGCGRDRRGDDDDDDTAGDGDADADGDTDADADADGDGDADGDVVPDPGTAEGAEWTDVEPNDDPAHAVPVGILTGPVWAGFVEPFTQVDTPDDTDFFVFQTGDGASLANVYIAFCGGANTFDVYLYEVVDQRMGAEIASEAGADAGCVTLVEIGTGTEILAATSTYVVEVRAQPGVSAGSLPAVYSA